MSDAYVRFRRLHWTDTSGNKQRCSVAASQVVADEEDDGFSTAVDTDRYEVFSVRVVTPGAGYAVGNELAAAGGTGSAAVFTVTAVTDAGAISGISIASRGDYSAGPSRQNAVTGGTGTGAVLELILAAFRDIYIGGGGGGGIQCRVTELFSADYVGVKKWDGATESGDQLLVAKSIPSRMPASQMLYGTTYNYTYTSDNMRVSSDGTDSEEQLLLHPFAVGDVIYVDQVDHTGVTVNAVELTRIEKNTEREWCGPVPTD